MDWIAIDGYNWGTSQTWSSWQPPDQTFGPMITRLQAITTKPLAITELGTTTTTSSGTNLAAKSQWLTDAFNYALTKNIKMILWFNQDKETDWAAFGGAQGDTSFTYNLQTFKTYAAYKTAISSNSFVSSNTTNPRLLTDNQFAEQ